MPVYEYQGKHYELSETDPAAAKERIQSFVGREPKSQAGPVIGAPAAAQIPTGGYPTVERKELAGEPKFAEKAAMYATAVPAGAVVGQALKLGTAGSRVAPYTSRLAEALTPTTVPGLAKGMAGAAAVSVPAEATRAALERRGVGPGGQALGEALAGGGAAGVGGAGMAGGRLVGRAVGRPVRKEAETLRELAGGVYQAPIAQAERGRETAARVVSQMERQPQVAAQRAAQAPLTAEQQQAALQAQVRQPVRERLGAARVSAEEEARTAAAQAAAAQETTAAAQQAVTNLEQRLLAKPTMTAEEFGSQLRDATRQLQQNLLRARSEQSNLGQVIRSAGSEPTVNTTRLIAETQALSERTRNPQVLGMLSEIQSLAKTGETAALSLEQVDSLRKYLSKDILNKFFATTGADKETLRTLRALRTQLIEATPQAYREALGQFSKLSRPLDIVERQGALKRVVDIDPMSTAEKLTEAQVVGEIINKARAGNPVFTRLLETAPNIKESARLYFTQDLFGKGAVPTEASLRTWLRNNERPLRQLGLYDEFKDIRLAKEAAQRAVDEAKLSERAATTAARETEKGAARAAKLSREAETRLQEALGTAAPPTQRPGETLAEALRRTRTGEKPAPIQTFIQTREAQADAVRSLTKMQDDVLAAKTPEEIKKAVQRSAEDLFKRGIIDERGRRVMLSDVENLQSMIDARDKARKVLRNLGYAVGVGSGLGYFGSRTIQTGLGG